MASEQRSNDSRNVWLGCLLVATLLTGIAYWRVLGFPFVFDDIIHLRWMQGRTILSLWTDAEEMQHYRPLVFTLWALSQRAFGATNALPLHVLSLVLHIANASLVGWLAYRLDERDPTAAAVRALAASALFAAYPLSYQVMPSPGSQSKPVSALLVLISCWLYWHGRDNRRPVVVFLALLCGALAPFAYEAAVTAGGFLVLTEYLLWRTGRLRAPSFAVLVAVLIGVPFLVAWKLVPSSYESLSFPGWEALWQNAIYFCQGITWPAALLAKPLMARYGLTDGTATAIMAGGSLLIISLLMLWRRRSTVLVVAVGWYVLFLLAQWVSLSFRYVIDGPRILYGAAGGMALLWADLASQAMAPSDRAGRLKPTMQFAGTVIGLVALGLMTAWGMRFAIQRIDLCVFGLRILEGAADRAEQISANESMLVVNVPAWITVNETDMPLGHEGYTLLTPYYNIELQDYVSVNRGIERDIRMASLPDIRQEWYANIGYHGEETTLDGLAAQVQAVDHVYVTGYEERDLILLDAGGVTAESPLTVPLARFGESVSLADIAAHYDGRGLDLRLVWTAEAAVEAPYTVLVHLYNVDGTLASQADGVPLRGTYPLSNWRAGDVVEDRRELEIPPGTRFDTTTVGIGLYRTDTGERASASDAEGQTLPDDVLRISLDELLRQHPLAGE